MKKNNNSVYPTEQFFYWLNKWGISSKQLSEAIIETGSIDADRIREFLVKKGVLISVFGLFYYSGGGFKRFLKVKRSPINAVSKNVFVSIPQIPFMTVCSN